MKAFGFLSLIETLLQSHVAESKLAYEFSGLAYGSKETPSWSNSTSIGPEPALRTSLHSANLPLQHRALRREARIGALPAYATSCRPRFAMQLRY
jgi:hypothetical protein